MAMSNDAPKHGGSGRDDLGARVAGVEARLGVIEKTMVTGETFQREIGALRDELHVGLAALRDEVHDGLAASRNESQDGFAALRGEIGALRQEMHGEIGVLRQEMHSELGAMRVEIAKIPFETFKWLLATAGLAAAIATAIYNIWFR
jgi:hypothetical protein